MDMQYTTPNVVLAVGPDDVQLGRGRPVVTSTGNQRFRSLILKYKPEYIASNRHAHKDIVARKIVSIITQRGGRFLRKIESPLERNKVGIDEGVDAWEIANEETSINKVKQALRENEPSVSITESSSKSVTATGKRKKTSTLNSARNSVDLTNLTAPSNVEIRAADLTKSTKIKKKRESPIETTPMSLAESIRINASKLGTEYTFNDSSLGPMKFNTNIDQITTSVGVGDDDIKFPRNLEQSTNIRWLGDPITSAYLLQSANQQRTNPMDTGTHHSLLPVIRNGSNDVNNSINDDSATRDSRLGKAVDVHEGIEIDVLRSASSSDDEKKPAAS